MAMQKRFGGITKIGQGYGDRYATDQIYKQIGLETPEAGNDYLQKTISSLTSSGMPDFMKSLQGIRENAAQRGVPNGGLATSYEGDLASAFQRNITNEAGSMAYNNYNSSRDRLLDLLSGQRDYETDQQNAKDKKKAGLFGGLGKLIGAGLSFIPGGGAAKAAIPTL